MLALVAAPAGSEPAAPQPAVGVIGANLTEATGPLDVVLRLSRPALAEAVAPNATNLGTLPDDSEQQAVVQAAEQQQQQVLDAARALGASELGSVSRSLNAVIVHADAATMAGLAAIPGVTSVTRVPSYDVSWPRDTPVPSGSLAQAARYLDLDRAADRAWTVRACGPPSSTRASTSPTPTSAAPAPPPRTRRATARPPGPA